MKAFPIVYMDYIPKEDHQGMDLRDYFAAKAMGAYFDGEDAPVDFYFIAERAYQMADAMMKARKA